MAAASVFLNPSFSNLYVDDSYTQFNYVIAKSLVAYADETGVKDLILGASSNVAIEAMQKISTYVQDTGDVRFYATTMSNNVRVDREILSLTNLSNVTTVSAGSSNSVEMVSTDSNKTFGFSVTTATESNQMQVFATTASNAFYFNGSLTTATLKPTNLVAQRHVFGKDMNMFYVNSNATNPGDVAETGYSFRMNSNMQLELVRYAKIVMPGGSNKVVHQRNGIFGIPALNSNTVNDVSDYAAFEDLASL